jgi:hypothetical protein
MIVVFAAFRQHSGYVLGVTGLNVQVPGGRFTTSGISCHQDRGYSERNHQERQFSLLERKADSICHLSTRSDACPVSEI